MRAIPLSADDRYRSPAGRLGTYEPTPNRVKNKTEKRIHSPLPWSGPQKSSPSNTTHPGADFFLVEPAATSNPGTIAGRGVCNLRASPTPRRGTRVLRLVVCCWNFCNVFWSFRLATHSRARGRKCTHTTHRKTTRKHLLDVYRRDRR